MGLLLLLGLYAASNINMILDSTLHFMVSHYICYLYATQLFR